MRARARVTGVAREAVHLGFFLGKGLILGERTEMKI